MHNLYKLKEDIIRELDEYGKKDLTKSSLEDIDKLAHAAKNLTKVIECCEDEDYSNAMGYSRRGGYSSDRNYVRPDGSYRDGEASYARGRGRYAKRDSMGRYSSAGDISEDLRMLMQKTDDERVKDEIRRLIDNM